MEEEEFQWAIAHPRPEMQFRNRGMWRNYLAAYAAARNVPPFQKTSDSGQTMKYCCRLCGYGPIVVRVRRKRLPDGQWLKNPSAVVVEVTLCKCGDPLNLSTFSGYEGWVFDDRKKFTALGNYYFRGRPYCRKDNGNVIEYSCVNCKEGKLIAKLTEGKSVSGQATWTTPLTVSVAVDCTSTCLAGAASAPPPDKPPVFCVVCQDDDAQDPVISLCCHEKNQCLPCLQGMAMVRPNHLTNFSHDGTIDHDMGAHNRKVIRFNPCYPVVNQNYYPCMHGCGRRWTSLTRFKYRGEEVELRSIVNIPIGFDCAEAIVAGDEDKLEVAIDREDAVRNGSYILDDPTARAVLVATLRQCRTESERRQYLFESGVPDAYVDGLLLTEHLLDCFDEHDSVTEPREDGMPPSESDDSDVEYVATVAALVAAASRAVNPRPRTRQSTIDSFFNRDN